MGTGSTHPEEPHDSSGRLHTSVSEPEEVRESAAERASQEEPHDSSGRPQMPAPEGVQCQHLLGEARTELTAHDVPAAATQEHVPASMTARPRRLAVYHPAEEQHTEGKDSVCQSSTSD